MTEEKAKEIVETVFGLYEKYGSEDYIGEPVSQIEHMCQSAQLAEADGHSDEVILAAFFHDIGHLCEHIMTTEQMDGFGVMDHETLGGNFLRQNFFSDEIAKLVESHVATKRYLTYKYPGYYGKLSAASKATLEKQGGIMTEQEAALFESDPLHPMYIQIRYWDDAAKQMDIPLPSLDKYKEMAIRHLLLHNSN